MRWSIRLPGGFEGSNANCKPATKGKRPSSFGYFETLFSSASWSIFPLIKKKIFKSFFCSYLTTTFELPLHFKRTIWSGNIIMRFKSPTLNSPGGNMQSLLKVPELMIEQSAFILESTMSPIKLPSFDSAERTVTNRPSNSVSKFPRSTLKLSAFKSIIYQNNFNLNNWKFKKLLSYLKTWWQSISSLRLLPTWSRLSSFQSC